MYVSGHKSASTKPDKPRLVDFEYPNYQPSESFSTYTGNISSKSYAGKQAGFVKNRMWVHPQSYIEEYLNTSEDDPNDQDKDRSWTLTAIASRHYTPATVQEDILADRMYYDASNAYVVKRMVELNHMAEPGYHILSPRLSSPRETGMEGRYERG